jgi:hypothetical protein
MPNWLPLLVAAGIVFSGAPVRANSVCKPALTVEKVTFSSPVNLRRYWSATVVADASSCTSQSGLFALAFVRLSETAPDLSFTEPFIWRAGEGRVRVEFWADEAVQEYWITDVAPCACREN